MKTKDMLICCSLLAMLMATLVACGSTTKTSSPGEYLDDSIITTKVKSLLAQDDFLKAFEISVETFKGTVQLSGFVDSQRDIYAAGEIARSVQGVTAVENNLIVKQGELL